MEAKYDFANKFGDQVLKCSECGFCQGFCPVFGAMLRPSYSARGKMLVLKEVMDGTIDLNNELIETLFQCTTCNSCVENCPAGVDVPEIIRQVRKDMVHIDSCHPAFKGMNEVLKGHTNIYAEEEPEDFERERNKKAQRPEIRNEVLFSGIVKIQSIAILEARSQLHGAGVGLEPFETRELRHHLEGMDVEVHLS